LSYRKSIAHLYISKIKLVEDYQMENEIWKDIPDYESLYKVSNLGNVLSFKQNKNGKPMKLVKNNTGYLTFGVIKDGKYKRLRINKLVYDLFNRMPPTNKHPANHTDGNKENNRYAFETGLRNHSTKKRLVVQKTLNNEIIAIYPSANAAATAIGFTNCSAITMACKKKLKTYKNFFWDYVEMNAE